MEKKRPERRRHPRFVVGGKPTTRMTAVYEASLVDISLGGALIEHAHIVRPGTISYLILTLKAGDVSVRCRVVRSVVHRPEVDPEGERVLIYRTGLEYVDLSHETLRLLDDYIVTGREGSHAPPAEP
ncbi:MAG: PilZ domain-containing protein [Candidatus Methylomirabilales bacterium]